MKNSCEYCKFRNFRENFIFAKNIKRHVCDVKNSRLVHYSTTSVYGREISPFCDGFISAKIRISEVSRNKIFTKILNLHYYLV